WGWPRAARRRPRTPGSRMSPRSPWVIDSDARVNVRRPGPLLALILLVPAAAAPRALAAEPVSAGSRSLDVRRVTPGAPAATSPVASARGNAPAIAPPP